MIEDPSYRCVKGIILNARIDGAISNGAVDIDPARVTYDFHVNDGVMVENFTNVAPHRRLSGTVKIDPALPLELCEVWLVVGLAPRLIVLETIRWEEC